MPTSPKTAKEIAQSRAIAHQLSSNGSQEYLEDLFISCMRAAVEAVRLGIDTHDVGDGSYCDTGEDMEWQCRSECTAKALKKLDTNVSHFFGDGEKEE